MLTQLKTNGAKSSVDKNEPKRGFRGKLQLFADKDENGFNIHCVDVGNYGTKRWQGDFNSLSKSELQTIIEKLTMLLNEETSSTEEFTS